MKKSTIVILWVAVSLMFFGGILAVSAYAISGGNIGIYYGNNGSLSDSRLYSKGKTIAENVEFTDISSLDINSDIGQVVIVPGETGGKFLVRYSYPSRLTTVSCTAENGVLKFSGRDKRMNGSGFNLFGYNGLNGDDYDVTITYPKGTAFDTINVFASLGTVDIQDTTADKIKVESNLGEISYDGVTSNSFSSIANAGTTHVKNSRLGNTVIESNLGEIIMRDITTSSLDISSSAGSVDITGALSGKTEIESNLGGISVETSLPREDYNLNLEVNLGAIELDGKHEKNSFTENNNAANTIDLQNDSGSIQLDFK